MKNVVPFKACDEFANAGINWTREPLSEGERMLRETFLTYESSCGMNGLASLLLLAIVTRRQGVPASDLQNAADCAEVMLAMQLRKHQCDVLAMAQGYLAGRGARRELFAGS
jgi:hypothetical protein